MDKCCETCKHWRQVMGEDYGDCCCIPPVIQDSVLTRTLMNGCEDDEATWMATLFPKTNPDQSCGMWTPKPEEPTP